MSRCFAFVPVLPPLAALALVLVACGGGSTVAPTDRNPPPPTTPFGLAARVPLDPLGFPTGQPQPRPVDIERAFPGLGFSRPVFLTAAPDGSSWIYVVEQGGRIFVFPNDDAVQSASPFLDIRVRVRRSANEEGLLGLAFDPDYGPTGGTFYVHYSASNPRRSVIARYTASFADGATPVASASSEEVVLTVGQPAGNHNAGMLAFGPDDDLLYVALGDGGGGNDPDDNGQDLGTLLGSMLRIDVRGETTYRIPTGNPFRQTPGARHEIWAYGLRNPWRFSFDRETGDLWVGDVGQGAREEIAVVAAGENHGWPIYEGNRSNRNPGNVPASAFTAPVRDYTRGLGTTVVGGYVYRGQDVPSLRGSYVYGDYGSGRVWALVRSGGAVTAHEEIQSVGQLCSFGEDERGELYAVSLGGSIWRFREPAGGGAPPRSRRGSPIRGSFATRPPCSPIRGWSSTT